MFKIATFGHTVLGKKNKFRYQTLAVVTVTNTKNNTLKKGEKYP